MAIRVEDLPKQYQEQVTKKQMEAITGQKDYASAEEMMRKYERHNRAAKSNAEGHHFEDEISAACKWYSAIERAAIEKTPESFRVTELHKGGRFSGRFLGKAQPDFQGTLSGGRSIIFDAKFTEKDRIMANALTKHQAELLEMHHKLGALCGVCVGFKDGAYFIPWEVWRNMKSIYGRKYILRIEMGNYHTDMNIHSNVLFLDYLKIVDDKAVRGKVEEEV